LEIMRALALILSTLAADCGPSNTPAPPEDHDGLSFVASGEAEDGAPLAFMLEYGTPDPQLPELQELPGLPARAHALRWNGAGWIEIEVRPTTAEACEALGICALDAAKDLCSRLPRDGEDLGE
jgi:hypothetical protein